MPQQLHEGNYQPDTANHILHIGRYRRLHMKPGARDIGIRLYRPRQYRKQHFPWAGFFMPQTIHATRRRVDNIAKA